MTGREPQQIKPSSDTSKNGTSTNVTPELNVKLPPLARDEVLRVASQKPQSGTISVTSFSLTSPELESIIKKILPVNEQPAHSQGLLSPSEEFANTLIRGIVNSNDGPSKDRSSYVETIASHLKYCRNLLVPEGNVDLASDTAILAQAQKIFFKLEEQGNVVIPNKVSVNEAAVLEKLKLVPSLGRAALISAESVRSMIESVPFPQAEANDGAVREAIAKIIAENLSEFLISSPPLAGTSVQKTVEGRVAALVESIPRVRFSNSLNYNLSSGDHKLLSQAVVEGLTREGFFQIQK